MCRPRSCTLGSLASPPECTRLRHWERRQSVALAVPSFSLHGGSHEHDVVFSDISASLSRAAEPFPIDAISNLHRCVGDDDDDADGQRIKDYHEYSMLFGRPQRRVRRVTEPTDQDWVDYVDHLDMEQPVSLHPIANNDEVTTNIRAVRQSRLRTFSAEW